MDKLPNNEYRIEWSKFSILDTENDEITELIAANSLLKIAKQLNLFVGDTNFKITKRIAGTINTADGVEFFRTVTPYKFIVGIGKLFLPPIVRRGLTKKIISIIEKKHHNL